MINPVIFTIRLGSFELPVYWYGVIVVIGIIVAGYLTQREVERRGEDPELVWDALIWLLVAGIVGARAWYVINDIAGGGTQFLQNPISIFNTRAGGMHIYGAFLLGAIALYFYARRNNLDILLFLDSVAPGLLIGQAIGRIANFINQELYGPPTDLPWGVTISAQHRIPPYNNLTLYPPETRFHPTFFYELIWNVIAGGLLLWLGRRYKDKIKPGSIFAGWAVLAGLGRFVLEWFRPDQPTIPGTVISYSRIVAGLLFLGGTLALLVQYEVIKLPWFGPGRSKYKIGKRKPVQEKAKEATK